MEHRYPMRREALITAEEYERMEDDDSTRDELVRGYVVREPAPNALHGSTDLNIAHALRQVVPSRVPGYVFVSVGFILARNPDTVRAPDVSFVAADRLPDGVPDGYIPFAPDLAVETVSKWDRMRALTSKAHEYLDAGTPLVWIVDPRKRAITVHRSGRDSILLGVGDALDGEDVIPGFALSLESLFTP